MQDNGTTSDGVAMAVGLRVWTIDCKWATLSRVDHREPRMYHGEMLGGDVVWWRTIEGGLVDGTRVSTVRP